MRHCSARGLPYCSASSSAPSAAGAASSSSRFCGASVPCCDSHCSDAHTAKPRPLVGQPTAPHTDHREQDQDQSGHTCAVVVGPAAVLLALLRAGEVALEHPAGVAREEVEVVVVDRVLGVQRRRVRDEREASQLLGWEGGQGEGRRRRAREGRQGTQGGQRPSALELEQPAGGAGGSRRRAGTHVLPSAHPP